MASPANNSFAGDTPSSDTSEPGSVNVIPANFPRAPITHCIDPDAVATNIIDRLNKAINNNDHAAAAGLFLPDCYWRDHLASSYDLRTLKGHDQIQAFLEEHPSIRIFEIDRASDFRKSKFGTLDGIGEPNGVSFYVNFHSKSGRGRGPSRPSGHEGTEPWQEQRKTVEAFRHEDPVVLVIGAGQAGLTLAARLKMLNVKTLLIDANEKVGDNWRKCYRTLVLHDPVWFDHMPYLPFPSHWPIFTPKEKLAEWFEAYVKILELNVWTRTSVLASKWDDEERKWRLDLQHTLASGEIEQRTLYPRHFVLATGQSGEVNMPNIKGLDTFRGDTLCHSSEWSGAHANGNGRKAVVVGACNSAHDIAQDLFLHGYDVTMVQRSSTCVVSSHAIAKIALGGLYEENGPPTEDADLWLWGLPTELLKTQQMKVVALQRQYDADVLDGLGKAGFTVDSGPNGSGLLMKYFQRGGGYYIHVGASNLIVEEKIKVKGGVEIAEVQANGLLMADGSELQADAIVFATGYQNMRTQARAIFGDDVYSRTSSVWGFNTEGEFRTIYGKSGHPGFWWESCSLPVPFEGRCVANQGQ